jgi:hypothetical protein
MNGSTPSSQQQLLERLICWDCIKARLLKFSAIGKTFPIELLKKYQSKPPYFCHYMAWRLGTWNNDQLFTRIDELLTHAELLPHWEHEHSLIKGGDFSDFWSLIWQLQVAEYLSSVGTKVSWLKSGPDLSVDLGGKTLFVECYVYRKSFGIELFIEEVLLQLGNDLRVKHNSFLALTLPNDDINLSDELSQLLSPLVDSELIAEKRRQAQNNYPVLLSQSSNSNLSIYIDGEATEAYDPMVLPNNTGDPTEYLRVALCEAAKAKANSNRLDQHHPNLLAASYLLSADAQSAFSHLQGLSHSLPDILLSENVDAFAFAAVGINDVLSRQKLRLVKTNSVDHPAQGITVSAI